MGWLSQTVMNTNGVLPALLGEPEELVNTVGLRTSKDWVQCTLKKAVIVDL